MNSELYYENKNTTLRKDNQNNLLKEDILNVTGSILGTMLEYVDNSSEEIDTLKEENKQLKILVENLELGVTLNEEQEKLLDSILLGSGKYESEK